MRKIVQTDYSKRCCRFQSRYPKQLAQLAKFSRMAGISMLSRFARMRTQFALRVRLSWLSVCKKKKTKTYLILLPGETRHKRYHTTNLISFIINVRYRTCMNCCSRSKSSRPPNQTIFFFRVKSKIFRKSNMLAYYYYLWVVLLV